MRFPTAEERKQYPSECCLCGGRIGEQAVTLPYVHRNGKVRLIRGGPSECAISALAATSGGVSGIIDLDVEGRGRRWG